MVKFLSEYQLPDHTGLGKKKSQWLLKFIMKRKSKQTYILLLERWEVSREFFREDIAGHQ